MTDTSGCTALHLAAMGGHKAVVSFLLEIGVRIGVKIDKSDEYHQTALRLAAKNGRKDVITSATQSRRIR